MHRCSLKRKGFVQGIAYGLGSFASGAVGGLFHPFKGLVQACQGFVQVRLVASLYQAVYFCESFLRCSDLQPDNAF
jgi:hypothetical protein